MGRSQNVCGLTTYGWTKNKVKPDPTKDGQRNLVLIGSSTDFYSIGVIMTHDLINPALHLLEKLGGKGQVEVYTQVDIDDNKHAYDLSPWPSKRQKNFKLKPYNYGKSRTWYREYPVHGVAPSRYTRRVWWIKSKINGFLYPFDPTTTIFTGEDARAGVAYHCLWAWRMAYGAPFDIRNVRTKKKVKTEKNGKSKKSDLWDMINNTVRPQCMLPVQVDLTKCTFKKCTLMTQKKIESDASKIDLSKCAEVTEPIFAYGCPKTFPSTPPVLQSGLPELVEVLKTKGKYVLTWQNGAKTIIQRSIW